MIQSTLELYADCARDTWNGLTRSAWSVAVLLLVPGIVAVAASILAPLGILGGILVGLVQALGTGWYLSLVEISVMSGRNVRPSDLKDNVGQYVWDVISVLFVFWIAELILGALLPGALFAALLLVATVVFNPAPEMIYQERSNGTALLADAASFMQNNWPEWLATYIGAGLFLGLWAAVVGVGASSDRIVDLLSLFGPSFGFTAMGSLVTGLAANRIWLGVVFGLPLLIFAHAFMLFRGHLYRRLRGSSRRGRAWQARTR